MKDIHILSIAPYPEFQELTSQVANEFPDISIDTFIGNLESAITYTKMYPQQDFDVIISRGATAEILRRHVAIPVIEVSVSVWDMLRILKQGQLLGQSIAVVGFINIVETAMKLCEILKYENVKICKVTSENVLECVQDLRREGIDLIIGDVMAVDAAKALGMRSLLITSSIDSVRDAVIASIQFLESLLRRQEEQNLLQLVVNQTRDGIVLLDESLQIRIANLTSKGYNMQLLTETLHSLIPMLQEQTSFYVCKRVGTQNIQIHGQVLRQEDKLYYLFFIASIHRTFLSGPEITIKDSLSTAEDPFIFFPEDHYIHSVIQNIQQTNTVPAPIFITGETGTGKSAAAIYLHSISCKKNHPFILIRCDLLTEKRWSLFSEDINSPLYLDGCTLFLENIHLLSLPLQNQIDTYLANTSAEKRHFIISSSSVDMMQLLKNHQFSNSLFQKLEITPIYIPTLNERRKDIPTLANMYVAKYNREYGKQIIGFQDAALDILKNYHWALNLTQFENTIRHLISTSNSYYISASEVECFLHADNFLSSLAPKPSNTLNLNQTLEEITKDIIRQVLLEENMNQAAAARRLGVSRNTIWRKLKGESFL